MLAENIKVAISSMKHLNYKENTIFLNEKQFNLFRITVFIRITAKSIVQIFLN